MAPKSEKAIMRNDVKRAIFICVTEWVCFDFFVESDQPRKIPKIIIVSMLSECYVITSLHQLFKAY